MLALTFDNDPKMQDYLTKSYKIAHRQVQASDIEEGLAEICSRLERIHTLPSLVANQLIFAWM